MGWERYAKAYAADECRARVVLGGNAAAREARDWQGKCVLCLLWVECSRKACRSQRTWCIGAAFMWLLLPNQYLATICAALHCGAMSWDGTPHTQAPQAAPAARPPHHRHRGG